MLQRNREIVRAVIVVCTTIAIIIFAVLLSSAVHPEPLEYAPADTGDDAVPVIAQQSRGFVLRDYNGVLAVFTMSEPDVPYYQTDVRIHSLRRHDQELLAAGITAKDRVQLQQLLDDFTT